MAITASWDETETGTLRVKVSDGTVSRHLSFAPTADTAVQAESALLAALSASIPGQAAQDACKDAFVKLRAARGWK